MVETSKSATEGQGPALLQLENISVEFNTSRGRVFAVNDVSYAVHQGETLAVVGESGSGKSVTVMALLGLLPPPPVCQVRGVAVFEGQQLLSLQGPALRAVRGTRIGMVFQDPMSALNPVYTVGNQIVETLRVHQPGLTKKEAWARATELLALVGVPQPELRLKQYPNEFSGGMRQRAMISLAIANDPALLIADEPTTALDVTIQAQVLEVLATARQATNAAMILITHDLGVVAETADRVVVMYGGTVVETADVFTLFASPGHPYTIGLLASQPQLGKRVERLPSIPGSPPHLSEPLVGCPFSARCALSQGRSICHTDRPELVQVGPGQYSACHFPQEIPSLRESVLVPGEGGKV